MLQRLKYAKYRTSLLWNRCLGFGTSSITGLRQQLAPGVLSVHRRDGDNIGDMMSSPFRYFRTTKPVYALDLEPLNPAAPSLLSRREPLVLGGGGLFFFEQAVNGLLESYQGPIIGWGIGRNGSLQGSNNRIQLEKFKLLGVRDWQSGQEWVPCVSCLEPLLDVHRTVQPSHEIVLYEHKDVPLPIKGLPTLNNGCMGFSKVLSFLASGETVVTNSYHGAYWARLLGRRVLILPFSDRLLHMRFPPLIATEQDYRQRAKEARPQPESLEICRAENLRFAARVSDVIGTELKPTAPS